MSASQSNPAFSGRRSSSSLLLPALLFSLAVHAAAGGVLFSNWHRLPVELPPPLTVALEAPPPIVVEQPRQQVERKQTKQVASSRAVPPLPVHRAPVPDLVAVERAEPAPPVLAPAVETPPAPAVIAKAPAAVNSAARADKIEPPHFNVAYLNNPRPAYPSIARKLGLEGLVVLRVQVNSGGAPEQVAVAKTSGAPVLDEAAMKAVQGWTFVPARRGDIPVAHWVDVPIRFQLKNAGGSD